MATLNILRIFMYNIKIIKVMKVKDLIKVLEGINGEFPVVLRNEDSKLVEVKKITESFAHGKVILEK